MEFKPKKQESSPAAGMIERFKAAEYENYSLRLGRTSRELGEWLLRFGDLDEKKRFEIEEYIRNLDAGRF
ncbi:MAG: hypothetical protein ABL952_02765 [Pyrinomonadaceae bacterium]